MSEVSIVAVRQKRNICAVVFVLVLWQFVGNAFGQHENDYLVTLERNYSCVQDAVPDIAAQTGYTVKFDSGMRCVPFTRQYKKIPLDTFLGKAFKGTNYTILFDDNDKTVSVEFFGMKSARDTSESNKRFDEDTRRAREKKIIVRLMNDPNYRDPETGLTNAEIWEQHARDRAALAAQNMDPEFVDPDSGLTNQELRERLAREKEIVIAQNNTLEYINPDTGLSNADFKKIRLQERKIVRAQALNPDYVDPDTGLTNKEFYEMRAREKAVVQAQGEYH